MPNDITATSSAILTIIPVRYETAWAKYEVETPAEPGSIPFEMLGLSNWGWTNGPFEVVPGMQYDMTLYAGQTEFVGYVHVAFFDDRVETTYEAALNVNFTDLHLYMGEDMLPNNGKKYRSSPGQLTWSATANSQTYTFINYYSEIGINPGDYVYIAAHAVVEIR